MVVESDFTIPDAVSFDTAIGLTQALVESLAEGKLAEPSWQAAVSALVSTENGARGFFVAYLSDERALLGQAAVTKALQTAPAIVAPLLVKNLAMSTAMAIAHRRNQQEALAQGSDRVRSRALAFILALRSTQLQEQAQKLATSIQTGEGDYCTFLNRWSYDIEQQKAIYQALEQTNLL